MSHTTTDDRVQINVAINPIPIPLSHDENLGNTEIFRNIRLYDIPNLNTLHLNEMSNFNQVLRTSKNDTRISDKWIDTTSTPSRQYIVYYSDNIPSIAMYFLLNDNVYDFCTTSGSDRYEIHFDTNEIWIERENDLVSITKCEYSMLDAYNKIISTL